MKTIFIILLMLIIAASLTYLAISLMDECFVIDDWSVGAKLIAPLLLIGMGMFVAVNTIGVIDYFERRKEKNMKPKDLLKIQKEAKPSLDKRFYNEIKGDLERHAKNHPDSRKMEAWARIYQYTEGVINKLRKNGFSVEHKENCVIISW